MAPARTLMRLGVLRVVVYCRRLVSEVPCLFGLGALLTIIGACILAGCYLSRTVDQATASDVNNQSFTYSNGAVFHSTLVNVSTTLCFTDNATNFKLSFSGGTATGTNRFDSCILTVTGTNYNVGTAGPLVGEVITLDPCDFDSDRKTLTISNRDLTATSTVAVACSPDSGGNVVPATPENVANQSFTFTTAPSGGVFDAALNNVPTTLSFMDDASVSTATTFTLVSVASISGRASGTSTIQIGSCTLSIDMSSYTVGTNLQRNSTIRLSPCNFDNTTRRLTVTNVGTATSDPGVPVP
jgi:hypothetical protein